MEPPTTSQTPSRPQVDADGRRHRVQFHKARTVEFSDNDYATLKEILGKEPMRFPGPHRLSPRITVDGRIHHLATLYLEHIAAPGNEKTVEKAGSALRTAIDYLVNEAELWDRDEFQSDVWAARNDGVTTTGHVDHHLRGLRKFLMEERPDELGGRVTAGRWNSVNSTIKRFFEWSHTAYSIPLPFDLTEMWFDGRRETSNGLAIPVSDGTTGLPIHPDRAEQLLQGALRIRDDGTQDEFAPAARDHAFLSLAFATGMRLNNLRWITHYELPWREDAAAGLVPMRVANAITKGRKGGSTHAFERWMKNVWAFKEGGRQRHIEALRKSGYRYLPADAIFLDDTQTDDVKWVGQINGKTITGKWNDTVAETRRRMVDPDPDGHGKGVSPLLFIGPQGGPLSAWTCGSITTQARDWVRTNLDDTFPDDFTTHDCRHSFAVYYALVTFSNVLKGAVREAVEEHFVHDQRMEQAVIAVQAKLGHTSKTTTTQVYLNMLTEFINTGLTGADVLRGS